MDRISMWRLSMGLALMVAVGFTWGCAQDVGDIDRTQPDKVEKALFANDDEWYLQQTVIDTEMEGGNIGDGNMGSSGAFAFVAFESPLKRVRWTITESVLYAHSTVELAEGLNEGFDEEDARRLGIVAAFPIRGHFDVQRSYSTSTGEPSNVIQENSSDRPWYEREFMRVDWSTNMVDGFRMFHGMYGRFSPASHDVPEEDAHVDPNRTRLSEDFIDTVTDYAFEPDINACFGAYGLDSIWACEGGRLSVRTSMKRVPEQETYEPLNYTDTREITRDGTPSGEPVYVASIFDTDLGYNVEVECTDEVRNWMLENWGMNWEERCRPANFEFFERFGYFRTERTTWDRYVGTSDDQRRYYAQRWNIWQTMLDDNGHRLDESERMPKPITFHLNLEYPKFMFDAAQETAEEWNDLFRSTVAMAMDISESELDTKLEDEYGHTDMFRIVENSCHPGPLVDWYEEYGSAQSEDLDSVDAIFSDYIGTPSGDAAMEAALWDLSHDARTNLCAELEYATEMRPDADAQFSWERVGDLRYSFFNWVEEAVPWAGYGPSAADPLTGEIIRANANYAGAYIRRQSTYAADLIQYFNGELSDEDLLAGVQIRDDLFNNDYDSERFGLTPEGQREMALRAGVDPDEVSATGFEERPEVDELDPFLLKYGMDRVQQEADILSQYGVKQAAQDERMVEFLEKPRVKNIMMGDVELQMSVEAVARERHGEHFTGEQLHQAYLDMHTPQIVQERERQRDRMLGERSIHLNNDITQALENLVTYQGVTDYFKGMERADIKEYFMNRVFIGTQLHEIGHAVGLRHNFSAHADALNYHDEYWEIERAVANGDIHRHEAYSIQGDMIDQVTDRDVDYLSQTEFQIASVMDYTADMTGRFAGLGKYDKAAIKFAYGGLVEQWKEDVELSNTLSFDLMLGDYRELPQIMASEFAGDDDQYIKGIDIIMNEREYVHINEAMEQRRQGIKKNTLDWANYEISDSNRPALDRTVEYNFCTDNLNGRVLDCGVWLYGGNQQEMVNHAFDSYRALQIFWRYRRHNIDRMYDNLFAFQNRLFRTFQVSQEPFRYYSIYRWLDLGVFTDDLQRAAIDGFNFYNEIFSTPEPGRYCPFDSTQTSVDPDWYYDLENTFVPAGWHREDGECEGYLDVPRGEGFLYNFGFSDEYEFRIDRVGTFIDKALAAQVLFQMSADFQQSAFFTDRRATNLSYWTLFKDEMLNMLGGLILGDYHGYGAAVNGGKFDAPVPVDPATFGTGAPNPLEGRPRIYTPQSLNHELNALAGGLIFSSGWEDREVDFTHYVKVSTTQDESQQFAEGVDIVEFVHPVSHQVYQAADIEERSVGVRMINRANELSERYQLAEQDLQQAEPGTTTYTQRRRTRDLRLEQLQDMVAKMDMVRDVIDMTYALR